MKKQTAFSMLVAAAAAAAFGCLAACEPVRRLGRLSDATLAWSQGNFGVIVDDYQNQTQAAVYT